MRRVTACAVLLAAVAGWAQDSPDAPPGTSTAPASEPAPLPTVTWHGTHDEAAADARKRPAPLAVIYVDPDAPASAAMVEMTLADPGIRELLAGFAAVKLNAAAGEGKSRLAKAGAGEAPVTQLFSPTGELLDSLPGFATATTLGAHLEAVLAWQKAASTTPLTPAARWQAVQARLKLSTRPRAVKEIDALLELPADKLPSEADRGRLRLARGEALAWADPPRARKDFAEALCLGAKDPAVGGRALLELADLSFRRGLPKRAVASCARYIERFPGGPEVGRAWYTKAKIELLGLNDPVSAAGTLEKFLDRRGDDPWAVKAEALLERARKRLPPATKPAKPAAAKTRPAAPKTRPAEGKVETDEQVPDGE